MIALPNVLILIAVGVLLAASTGLVIAFQRQPKSRLSRWEFGLGVAPSVLQLGLYFSLALHMHQSLGGWPPSIGMDGFPPGLLAHYGVAANYFSVFLLATLFVWPVVFVLCAAIRSWRRWTPYLSIHGLSFVGCICFMAIAPSEFVRWWWD